MTMLPPASRAQIGSRIVVRWLQSPVLLLSMAVLAGLLAMFLSRHYISSRIEAYQADIDLAEQSSIEPMTRVVVPVRALEAGDVVTVADLSVREISARLADDNNVREATADKAIGRRVDAAIGQGKPLLWAHLADTDSASFSAAIADGRRAMTVAVDRVGGLAGLLQPGDRVDLSVALPLAEGQAIVPLIEHLLVLATGTQTRASSRPPDAPTTFTTITVDASPADAQRIALAARAGQLVAMLRHPTDSASAPLATLTIDELVPVTAEPPLEVPVELPLDTAPVNTASAIEYIIGGSR